MLYVVAEVFQNKIIIDKVNVVFKQYPNIPKHCPPADVIQAILIHINFSFELNLEVCPLPLAWNVKL